MEKKIYLSGIFLLRTMKIKSFLTHMIFRFEVDVLQAYWLTILRRIRDTWGRSFFVNNCEKLCYSSARGEGKWADKHDN